MVLAPASVPPRARGSTVPQASKKEPLDPPMEPCLSSTFAAVVDTVGKGDKKICQKKLKKIEGRKNKKKSKSKSKSK
jgi:hypothetical protein